MGYTPEDQIFEPSLEKLIEGISEFDKVVEVRINSCEYKKTHIEEICELSIEMRRLKIRLLELKANTY